MSEKTTIINIYRSLLFSGICLALILFPNHSKAQNLNDSLFNELNLLAQVDTTKFNFLKIDWDKKYHFTEFDECALIELEGKKCERIDFSYARNPELDSSSQLGMAKLFLNDSNKNTTWQKLTIEQLSDAQGPIPIKAIKTFTLIQKDGILRDSFFAELPVGQYRYVFEGQNSLGCSANIFKPEFWVGHHSSTRIDENGFIYDSIYYFHPAGNAFCRLANWWYNTSCIDSNAFFYNPDSNTVRKNRSENGLGKWYNPPSIKEAIYYDFNSDGILDTVRTIVNNYNWDNNATINAMRIPVKYAQDTLTVWSRDSLGNWQSSNPIPYNNCSQFTRHDKLDFEPYYGECTFSSNGNYKEQDSLNVIIKKVEINGKDTTLFPVDRFTFQANLEVTKNLDYGPYVVERITNNLICDKVKKDTVFSCLNFRNYIIDSVFEDSILIRNKLKHRSDSILIRITDTLNYLKVVDSFWLEAGKTYERTFPNGSYWVEYSSKNLKCGKGKVYTFLNSASNHEKPNLVLIYPNPTSDHFFLQYPNAEGSYYLIDFSGRKVLSGTLTQGLNKLETNKIPSGVYLIQIEQHNEFVNQLIIKN